MACPAPLIEVHIHPSSPAHDTTVATPTTTGPTPTISATPTTTGLTGLSRDTTRASLASATNTAIHTFHTQRNPPFPLPLPLHGLSTQTRAHGQGTRASASASPGAVRGHVACLSLLLEYGFPVLRSFPLTLILIPSPSH